MARMEDWKTLPEQRGQAIGLFFFGYGELLALILFLCLIPFISGCAARGPKKARNARVGGIPIKCVQEAVLTPQSACYVTQDPKWFVCDGLGVKAACVTYKVEDNGDNR